MALEEIYSEGPFFNDKDICNMSQDVLIKKAEVMRRDMPGAVRRQALKAASVLYEGAGRGHQPLGKAFRRLSLQDPGPAANSLATAIHSALGKSARDLHSKEANAGALVSGIQRLLGFASTAPELIKMMTLAGAGVGAAGGAGIFALNRTLSKDDVKVRKLQRQRDIMKRLTRDIDEELKVRNLDPTPKNTAAVVDYLT